MLFLLNNAGVPSTATFVQVSSHPTDVPPKGTITAPAGDVPIQAGQAVNFAGTASDADGSVSTDSWFFPAGKPTTSSVLSPGAIAFLSAGTFVASLTVVDNAGVNDPSPPTRTITVQPDKLSVKIVSPLANATVKGSVAVTVSATGSTGAPNVFRFGVDIGGPPLATTTAPHQVLSVSGSSATFTWNSAQQANGVHTLWVSCTDAHGNFGSASEKVTVAN
jgi:Bacterial Ig domain/PKD domain